MAKTSTVFRCTECGWSAPKWVGRCGECQAWGTVTEGRTGRSGPGSSGALVSVDPATPIGQVDVTLAERRSTGLSEFDRVLGGGFVPGAVILMAGEPGVGKSTLLLDVAARWARSGGRTLYVSGEESASQVRLRADRISALADTLLIAAESDLAAVLSHVEDNAPDLLIVDSVQTIASPDVDGAAGGVTQIRQVTAALINAAKARAMTTVLVGHVTKDGNVAGPRALEHLVDVVVHFEGDRHGPLRLVRAVKNRFGPCDELGCFELIDEGLRELPDPSGMFLGNRVDPASGTAVTVTIEGRRPLVAEVQALVSPTGAPQPRRVTSGLDSARIAMMLGVLERRAGYRLADHDCFVATVGGVKLTEPATDLAVACAIASSVQDVAIASDVLIVGEVGLSGDVRSVRSLDRRLSEGQRLGFRRAIIPRGDTPHTTMELIEVPDVMTALRAILTPAD
jgi:DNA repair protein RadA/Sms